MHGNAGIVDIGRIYDDIGTGRQIILRLEGNGYVGVRRRLLRSDRKLGSVDIQCLGCQSAGLGRNVQMDLVGGWRLSERITGHAENRVTVGVHQVAAVGIQPALV